MQSFNNMIFNVTLILTESYFEA